MRLALAAITPMNRDRHSNGLPKHTILGIGSVLNLARQLTARRIDVITARFANSGDDTSVQQDSSEGLHA